MKEGSRDSDSRSLRIAYQELNVSVRNLGFKVYIIKAVKLLRANGGCLGARSLRRT